MSNSLKKIVQNVLLYPRKNKYNKEYLALMDKYDQSIKELEKWVSEDESKAQTRAKVESLSVSELMSNIQSEIKYNTGKYYIIHTEKTGVLSESSERVVYEFVNDNPYALVCYGDEDYFAFIQKDGKTVKTLPSRNFDRFFKPEYSPDTLVSFDYMGTIVVRGNILNEVAGDISEKEEEAVLYELTFLACKKAVDLSGEESILRIPRVIASKGVEVSCEQFELINKNGKANEVLIETIQNLSESGADERFADLRSRGQRLLGNETLEKEVKVSIIIPSKDNPEMLFRCIDKLNVKPEDNIEIIVVDNGSSDENKKHIEAYLKKKENVKYIYQPEEFNYSHMNNTGVKAASGEVIVLLNDDIEANGNKWIKTLTAYALRENTGAVGCKLLYPDGLIQHTGIACGVDGPAHEFMGEEDKKGIGHGENIYNRNVLAVTGACLVVRRSLYEEINGLCEELKVGYNDVDFCLSLAEKGYRNLLINDVTLIHHESVSRGKDSKSQAKSVRLKKERALLVSRHEAFMLSDPYKGGTRDFELSIEKSHSVYSEVDLIRGQKRQSNDSEGWVYTCFEEISIEDESLTIRGFSLVPGIDNMRFDFEMLLEKDEEQLRIPLKRSLRTDLSGRFNGTENTELCGFCQKTKLEIPKGEYSIKIYAKDHGNVREIITDTGRTVVI